MSKIALFSGVVALGCCYYSYSEASSNVTPHSQDRLHESRLAHTGIRSSYCPNTCLLHVPCHAQLRDLHGEIGFAHPARPRHGGALCRGGIIKQCMAAADRLRVNREVERRSSGGILTSTRGIIGCTPNCLAIAGGRVTFPYLYLF